MLTYSGPHHNSIGKRFASRNRVIIRKAGGHESTGPSGVWDQSKKRTSPLISLPSTRKSTGFGMVDLLRSLTVSPCRLSPYYAKDVTYWQRDFPARVVSTRSVRFGVTDPTNRVEAKLGAPKETRLAESFSISPPSIPVKLYANRPPGRVRSD